MVPPAIDESLPAPGATDIPTPTPPERRTTTKSESNARVPRAGPPVPPETAEAPRRPAAATGAARRVAVLRPSGEQKKARAALTADLKPLNLGTEDPR